MALDARVGARPRKLRRLARTPESGEESIFRLAGQRFEGIGRPGRDGIKC